MGSGVMDYSIKSMDGKRRIALDTGREKRVTYLEVDANPPFLQHR